MSTPQVLATPPLPTPPAFPRRTSTRNARLQLPTRPDDPPIPPRLVGSPLLDKLISPHTKSQQKQQRGIWIDGDEFGTSSHSPSQSPVLDATHSKTKRSQRPHPPPEPRYTTSPPPLPPFASSARHSSQHKTALAADLLPSTHRYDLEPHGLTINIGVYCIPSH